VTFEKVDDSTVKIVGFGDEDDVVVAATLDLLSKTKTITIPFQKLDVDWQDGYDVYFTFNQAVSHNFGTGFDAVAIQKEDDGTLQFSLGSTYTWEFAATSAGTLNYAGRFAIAYATVFTKEP